jgi:hypothetical protein
LKASASSAALAAALAVLAASVLPAAGSEAPRARTGSEEPPALSILAELRPIPLDLPVGRALDTEWEFGLDLRTPGILRCSVRLPLCVRIGLAGPWARRSDAAWGDPAVEAGVFFRRGAGFRFLGAGYAAPLGRWMPDPDRPLRPAPGSGVHRATVSAGLGRIRDPASLTAGLSWTVTISRPDAPEPWWRPADLALSLSLVEVLNDRAGILLGLSPRFRASDRGPGAGPHGGFDWGLDARVEVHLRAGRAFFRTGVSRSLTDPGAAFAPAAGVEYEVRFRTGAGP